MDVLRTAEWNQGESGAAWGVGGVTEVKQMDKCGKGGTLRRGGSGLLHHRKKNPNLFWNILPDTSGQNEARNCMCMCNLSLCQQQTH